MAQAKGKQKGAATRNAGAQGANKSTSAALDAKATRVAAKTRSGAQKAKRSSGLGAAAKVLSEAGEPLSCKQMVEQMLEKGYWKTSGKTPAATIYAGILREIRKKGEQSRFRKTDRGRFALAQ